MAIEIQIERMRVKEAIAARDATLHRLSEAYLSLRQKAALIETLKQELESNNNGPLPRSPTGNLAERLENERLNAHILGLEATIMELRTDIQILKDQARANSQNQVVDPPPCYDAGVPKVLFSKFSIFPVDICLAAIGPELGTHVRLFRKSRRIV